MLLFLVLKYLLPVADYNILDADMYTLHTLHFHFNIISIIFILFILYFQYKSQGVTTVIASPLNKCLKFEVFSFLSK